MTQAEGYRARTLMVRKAARQHLLEVRRQRLAKHGFPSDLGSAGPCDHGPEVIESTEVSILEQSYQDDGVPSVAEEAAAVPAEEQCSAPTEPESVMCFEEPDVSALQDVGLTDDLLCGADTDVPPSDPMAVGSVADVLSPTVKPATRKTRRPKKQKQSVGSEDDNLSILAAAMQEIDDDDRQGDTQSVAPAAARSDATVVVASRTIDETIESANEPVDPSPSVETAEVPVTEAESAAQDAIAEHLENEPCATETTSPENNKSEPVAPTAANSLEALPGAGPGLIWMLGQVGITSMEDLAQSDADVVSRNLGLVGQILNVGSWIVFARATTNRDGS